MPKDARTYIKVHDGMPEHPKVVGISDAAFRTLVTFWCYCARQLTNGKVPAAVAKREKARVLAELEKVGLLESRGGDWVCHDYLDYQRSADEVAAMREKRQEAGAKGGHARAANLANGVANATDELQQTPSKRGSKSVAEEEVRSKEVQKTSSKPSQSIKPVASTEDSRFAAFWDVYPLRVGKGDALRRFDSVVRRGISVDAIVAGAVRYAESVKGADPKYTAHPATWLNRDGWDDEIAVAPVKEIRPPGWEFGQG